MKKTTAKIFGILFAVAFAFIALILFVVDYTIFSIIVLIFGFLVSYGLIKNKNLKE